MVKVGGEGGVDRGYLVDEVLAVVVREALRGPYDLVEVCVHELIDDIDVLEFLAAGRRQDVLYPDDVLVVEVPEELDLSQGPLRIHDVFKSLANFLDGNLFVRLCVPGRAAGERAEGLTSRRGLASARRGRSGSKTPSTATGH